MAAAPVLARLYTPTDFGVFSVTAALVVTLGTISALRFELAVPLPKEESQAYSLVTLGLWSAFGFALLGSAIVFVLGDAIAAGLGEPRLGQWLWVVPPAASTLACLLLLNQLAVRHRRYSGIARRNFLASFGMVLAQIGSGVAGLRTGGLILGFSFGHLVGASSLLAGAGLRSSAARVGRSTGSMVAALRRYRRFPLLLTSAGLLNVAGHQVLVVLVSMWYGTQFAGWLGLTQRVLALPVTLVGTAIAQVYLAELAQAVRGNLARASYLFRKASRFLFAVAVVLLVLLLTMGPTAFGIVFGEEWRPSGEFARALSLGLAAQLVASPLSQTLIALERQGLQLAWDAARFASLVAAVAVSVAMGATALTAIWLASGVSVLFYAFSWWLSLLTLRRKLVTDDCTQRLAAEQPPANAIEGPEEGGAR